MFEDNFLVSVIFLMSGVVISGVVTLIVNGCKNRLEQRELLLREIKDRLEKIQRVKDV